MDFERTLKFGASLLIFRVWGCARHAIVVSEALKKTLEQCGVTDIRFKKL